MIFALLFCLFFTLDVLFELNFQAFGLMPMDGLKAAILMFTGIFFMKIPVNTSSSIEKIHRILWIAGLFFLALKSIFCCIRLPSSWGLHNIILYLFFSGFFKTILSLYYVLLLIIFVSRMYYSRNLNLWMILSNIFTIFSVGGYLYMHKLGIGLPFPLRGFYDLPMFFSLLVCIDITIKEKFKSMYHVEYKKMKGVFPW